MARTFCGTPQYISPEIIESKPYNQKSDIWSLGVLLYEMCALEYPFNSKLLHSLFQKIIKGVYQRLPIQFSAGMSQLVKSLLQKDPEKRPSINAILKMPLIQPRIGRYLQGEAFKDEFSHTILHNHDLFKAYKQQKL